MLPPEYLVTNNLKINMIKTRKLLYPVLILLVLSASCYQSKEDKSSEKDLVQLAIKAEKYLQKAQYLTHKGETTWKIMPDSTESKGNPNLYYGTPGVVLFYLELYNTTKDSSYLNDAISGADYLIKSIPDTIPNQYNVGLYVGISGIGFTLAEMYKITDDDRYKKEVLRTIDLLNAAAENSATGIHWGQISDIVYGSAGIGLYLQYVADELNINRADSLAILVANGLLDQAIDTLGGLRWKFTPKHTLYMDNFSHGTSGVGYFLSETYQRTKNEKYLEACLKATNVLDSLANDKGYIPHHFPGGEDLYYLNWCHGPAGTSRFYYSLYTSTKDEQWLKKVKLTANNMMNEGINTSEKPGYWNNVGKCCGATGVAEYYLWLYNITGNKDYLDFSNEMTQSILLKASENEDYMKWIQAEHRTKPDMVAAQTGYMQGNAGIGLWFLQLNAHNQNKEHLIYLPDKPKVKKN